MGSESQHDEWWDERLSRLLATARAIHQELLGSADERSLLRRACVIAVEVGGFVFAWVGRLQGDGIVQPVTEAGQGAGYLEHIAIAVEASPKGRGPTASALRGGSYVVCSDIETDPRMEPWREEALRRGFRSSGAFPVRRAGRIWGALNVYSPHTGFGHPREIELLGGVAEDIGFALDFMDRERERAESQARLVESERRYRALVEGASDGIFVAGPDLRYVEVNPAGCAMLGYERDELIGRRLVDVIEPEDLAVHPLALKDFVPGESFYVERRLRRKDGSVVEVEIHGVQLPNGGFQSVTRDVSERKRAHAEQSAIERMASLGRLAQAVGHEINNPLAYVSLNLELAQRRVKHDGEHAELVTALEAAQDGVRRIADVVRALGAFGRGDSGELTPVSISRAVESAIALTANRMKHVATVNVKLWPELWVSANEYRLVQVLVNLMLNSVDAMEELPGRAHQVLISAKREEPDRVVVEVADSGSGIAPEDLSRVFDPFYTTKPAGRGTGIGLSISRAIVSSFGGTLEATSSALGGACLRIGLRESRPASAGTAEPDPSAAALPRRLRVLVVDDEPLIGRVIRAILADCHVDLVGSVDEALVRCRSEAYDCVLCDLMLPGKSGDVLYESLSAGGSPLASRVVFMTGGAFTPGTQEFLARFEDRRIDKPFSADDLREKVLAVCGVPSP